MSIDGVALVNLDHLDFAAKNDEYLRLREAIDELTLSIAACDRALTTTPDDEGL